MAIPSCHGHGEKRALEFVAKVLSSLVFCDLHPMSYFLEKRERLPANKETAEVGFFFSAESDS
jgi:hypothetical protein